MARNKDSTLRSLLLVAALACGLYLRLDGVGSQALFGDEYHTHQAGETSLGSILTTFDRYGSHVMLPLLQHVALALCGDGVLSLRLPAILPGLALLILLYPLTRTLFGRTPALLGTWVLALHPMHVYYSRFARGYALLALLGVLAIWAVGRATGAGRGTNDGAVPSRAAWWAVGALVFLLPYTHLSSVGFVAALALVAFFLTWRAGAPLRRPLVAFGVGAGLCALAFVPLWSQVRSYFVEAIPDEFMQRPSTWFGIPLLLAGGTLAAWVWMLGFPLATVALLRERKAAGLLALAALVGPLAALLATTPHGMEFAYARYLLLAVPIAPLVIAFGMRRLAGRVLARENDAERLTLALGLAAVALMYLEGPFASRPERSTPFEGTYIAQRSLPAFEEPWPGTPEIYGELAREAPGLRIVETPPLLSRAVLTYRNHARLHGHRVSIGWPIPLPAGLRGDLYTSLDGISAEDADVVILHRTPRQEVAAYWRFVYEEVWPALVFDVERDVNRGFMRRHADSFVRGQPSTAPEFTAQLGNFLRSQLGPPSHEDELLSVWRLTN